MRATVLMLFVLLWGCTANAQDPVTLRLTVDQARILQQFNEAALKSLGKPAARAFTFFDDAIETAIAEATRPKTPEQK